MKRTDREYVAMKERRAQKNRRRKARRSFMTGVTAVLLIMVCTFCMGTFSEAHAAQSQTQTDVTIVSKPEQTASETDCYYKSIQIQEGDTLWSIAAEYTDGNADSICAYVDELAAINQIAYAERDSLKAGDYLMVTYDDADFH